MNLHAKNLVLRGLWEKAPIQGCERLPCCEIGEPPKGADVFKVKATPRKSSVVLSQKSVSLPVPFHEQESPGVPNTIPNGQLLLIPSGPYGP